MDAEQRSCVARRGQASVNRVKQSQDGNSIDNFIDGKLGGQLPSYRSRSTHSDDSSVHEVDRNLWSTNNKSAEIFRTSKMAPPSRASKPSPQSSALRLCRPPLRSALSTFLPRVGIPLGRALATSRLRQGGRGARTSAIAVCSTSTTSLFTGLHLL